MKSEVIQAPEPELIDFFEKRIEEFNQERWEVKQKIPLAVKVEDPSGSILAGAAGKSFGLWLFIDNLWVQESLRGQGLGSEVLGLMERAGQERGCRFVLLETLNFQARPFYERFGYKVSWTQHSYPRDGSKYFMVKELS